jgi:hypothetical protein
MIARFLKKSSRTNAFWVFLDFFFHLKYYLSNFVSFSLLSSSVFHRSGSILPFFEQMWWRFKWVASLNLGDHCLSSRNSGFLLGVLGFRSSPGSEGPLVHHRSVAQPLRRWTMKFGNMGGRAVVLLCQNLVYLTIGCARETASHIHTFSRIPLVFCILLSDNLQAFSWLCRVPNISQKCKTCFQTSVTNLVSLSKPTSQKQG